MTSTELDVLDITITSPTTALVGDMEISATADCDIRQLVVSHARNAATEAGRALPVTITNAATQVVKHWTVTPDGRLHPRTDDDHREPGPVVQQDIAPDHTHPGTATHDDGSPDDIADAAYRRTVDQPPVSSAALPESGSSRSRTPVEVRRRPRLTPGADWKGKTVKTIGAVGALVLAATVGATVFGHGGDAGSVAQRPLDTYSSSGPGDLTSGPGIIEAADYAYYVYPRTAADVLRFWSADSGQSVGDLQTEIDKTDRRITHRLDITATRDPLVYSALLTLTTPDGVAHPYHEVFHLQRVGGQYRIANKTDCRNVCPIP